MGLPTITAKWSEIPAEYKIPVPDIYKKLLNRLNSLPVISDIPATPGYYNEYNIRNFSISLARDEMVFSSSYPNSEFNSTAIEVCDPNAVFILPRYTSNYPKGGFYSVGPYITGTGVFPTKEINEVKKIGFPRWFYVGSSSRLSEHGAVAIDIDDRSPCNTSDYLYSLFAPIIVVKATYDIKTYGTQYWTTFNKVFQTSAIDLLFGFTTYLSRNNYIAQAYVSEQFDTTIIRGLYTCIVSPSQYCELTITGSPIITPYESYSETPYDDATNYSGFNFSANINRNPYAAFKNIIFIEDSDDFNSLFAITHEEFLDRIVNGEEEAIKEDGPYDPGGNSKPDGGDGAFDDGESDNIAIDIPNGSSESDISSSGLFTRYIMSRSTVKSFGDWLFSDNIIDTIVKEFMALIFASPMEAIISMISYPFSIGSLPGIGSVASNVYYGNKDSGIASLGRMTNGFASIDWGTVAIAEYWGNFLDYSPHTKIELYLPWSTGFVDIDPNDVMSSTISIITNIELDKGTCVHNVYNGRGAVIGQYSGVCGKQLPITALDTSGKALSAAVAAVATAVSAGAAGATAAGAAATESAAVGALRGAKAMGLSPEAQLTAAQSMRGLMSKFHKDYTPVAKAGSKVAAVSALAAARIPPHIQRSGSFTGNGSGLGVQYPYFILSRPDQSVPEQYGVYVGYPSNIYASLGSLKGYTEVGSIFLDGVACTENERAEIDSLLKGGVIL